jgi:hypothetical protein
MIRPHQKLHTKMRMIPRITIKPPIEMPPKSEVPFALLSTRAYPVALGE